jgi:hypothetical protein
MNTTCEPERLSDNRRTSDITTFTSPPEIIDFSNDRHRLMLEVRQTTQPSRTVVLAHPLIRQKRLTGSVFLLEQIFYWLVCAPALGYLVYVIFGL